MDVTEFVTKAMNDRGFMFEVFTHIPESATRSDMMSNPDTRGQIGLAFGRLCFPGAQAMGYDFAEDELMAESDRQLGTLNGFDKVKFGARMLKTLRKARSKE